MFGREKTKKRSGTLPTAEELADRMPDRDDLVRRIEALSEALVATRDRVQDLSARGGRRGGRGGRAARGRNLEAARAAAEQARHAADRLPGRDEMLDLITKTSERLWPERAAARRAQARRRQLSWGLGLFALLAGAAVAVKQWRGKQEVGPPIDMQPGVNGPVEPVSLDEQRAAGGRSAGPLPD